MVTRRDFLMPFRRKQNPAELPATEAEVEAEATAPTSQVSRAQFLTAGAAFIAMLATPRVLQGNPAQDPQPTESRELDAKLGFREEGGQIVDEAGNIVDPQERDLYFYAISVLMGLGIAVDVGIATVAMYRSLDTQKKKALWTGGVTASHILLPIVGGGLTAGLDRGTQEISHIARYADGTQRVISFAAFGFLSRFLYTEVIDQGESKDDEEGGENSEEKIINPDSLVKYFGALWSVSADAFISGPPKWEEVKARGWDQRKIFESVLIGGLTVGAVALATLKGAEILHQKYGNQGSQNTDSKISQWAQPASVAECLALNYFGASALVNGSFKGLSKKPLGFLDLAPLSTAWTATLVWLKKRSVSTKVLKTLDIGGDPE